MKEVSVWLSYSDTSLMLLIFIIYSWALWPAAYWLWLSSVPNSKITKWSMKSQKSKVPHVSYCWSSWESSFIPYVSFKNNMKHIEKKVYVRKKGHIKMETWYLHKALALKDIKPLSATLQFTWNICIQTVIILELNHIHASVLFVLPGCTRSDRWMHLCVILLLCIIILFAIIFIAYLLTS